jgi:hypothetical protein
MLYEQIAKASGAKKQMAVLMLNDQRLYPRRSESVRAEKETCTFIDASAEKFLTIYVSAGRRVGNRVVPYGFKTVCSAEFYDLRTRGNKIIYS